MCLLAMVILGSVVASGQSEQCGENAAVTTWHWTSIYPFVVLSVSDDYIVQNFEGFFFPQDGRPCLHVLLRRLLEVRSKFT
jgi:hypothetical protein